MNIFFSEKDHKYFLDKEPNRPFTSVSKVLGTVKTPFDSDFWSKKKAAEAGITQQEMLAQWKAKSDHACNIGSHVHKLYEDDLIAQGAKVHKTEGELKKAFSLKELQRLEDGIYPELIIPHIPSWTIGTADIIEIKGKDFWISDYKGFSLDTPIATNEGWKNISDLQKGDLIFDGNGDLTPIRNVSAIHYNPCYKITFDTNDELVCDHEHKWVVSSRLQKSKFCKYVTEELTTLEIEKKFKNGYVINIECVSLNLPDIDLPLDPYVLGLWLGDGNRTCGSLTCENDDIWEEIKKRGFEISVNHNRNFSNTESRTILGISTQLRKLNLLGNKHIPDLYMRSSYNQRLELLRGFMDADGHFNKRRKRNCISTTKMWQVNAFVELISSLGLKPTVLPYKGSGFGKTNIQMYSINFSSLVNPFLSRNKDYDNNVKKKNFFSSKVRYIKNIEKIETVPTKCLEVESETHTYLAGKTLIKTHNTNEDLQLEPKKYYKKELGYADYTYLLSPVSHVIQTKFNIYQLQLSMYSYFLECLGYNFKGGIIKHIIVNKNKTNDQLSIDDIQSLTDINQVMDYPIQYMKDEVIAILKSFKLTNK